MSLKLYQSPAGSSIEPALNAGMNIPHPESQAQIDVSPSSHDALAASGSAKETIEYISGMTRQLAGMAQQSGARRLGLLLTLAAEEAEMHTGRRSKR